MTITILPVDADPGTLLPKYTAQQYRQGRAAQHGGGSGRRLGLRSGFRVDTPSNVLTATSTTWTLGPCAAMIDPGATTHQGGYDWATDANETGAVTAADATNPRKDIVYIRVNDSSAGDGSGALSAPVLYLAGPMDGTNVPPALPTRSFLVGTISVPVSGGGSPTVTLNPARYVSAGADLPISSDTERDALTPYVDMVIWRTDTKVRQRWNGTRWVGGRWVLATKAGYGRYDNLFAEPTVTESIENVVTLTGIVGIGAPGTYGAAATTAGTWYDFADLPTGVRPVTNERGLPGGLGIFTTAGMVAEVQTTGNVRWSTAVTTTSSVVLIALSGISFISA